MIDFLGSQNFIAIIYLVASALFILALKWMNSPATARRGIFAGETGMVLAIGGTLLQLGVDGKLQHLAIDYTWVFIALGIGTAIGIPLGLVQMTAVPQRTALSHAFGAFCVTLVGTAEFYLRTPNVQPFMMSVLCCDGIRARQQAADRCRRTGWLFGLHSFGNYVEGHEPLVYQRGVRSVWASCASCGGNAGSASSKERVARGSCGNSGSSEQSCHRAGI